VFRVLCNLAGHSKLARFLRFYNRMAIRLVRADGPSGKRPADSGGCRILRSVRQVIDARQKLSLGMIEDSFTASGAVGSRRPPDSSD